MRKRDKKIQVTVTCITQPPVDKTKGAEYLGAYVNASLHARDGKDKLITNNPSESDGRKDSKGILVLVAQKANNVELLFLCNQRLENWGARRAAFRPYFLNT